MKQKIKRGKRRTKGRQVNQVELTCCPTVGGKVIRRRITHESTRDVYAHLTVFIIDAPMRTHVRTHTYSLTFILTPTHSDVYYVHTQVCSYPSSLTRTHSHAFQMSVCTHK